MIPVSRTNIDIDEDLIRKARKLTHLKTKRQIVDRALDLLVRSESRKGILRYYGAGISGRAIARHRGEIAIDPRRELRLGGLLQFLARPGGKRTAADDCG